MTAIYPSNPDWNLINFKLQLAVSHPALQIQKITKYSNQFDANYQYHLKLDAFIDATNLQQHNLQDLRNQLTNNHIFESGVIRNQQNGIRKPRKILFFKIAIGEIMPIHKSGLTQIKDLQQFPENYDALYVTDAKEEISSTSYKYKLKSKQQYKLEYEVDFVVNDIRTMKKWDANSIKCQYCFKTKAEYFCEEDNQVFCMECYGQMHRSSKKKTHSKSSLNPYNATNICPFHSGDRLNFYCFDCRQLRCEKCVNNPAHKNQMKHQTIPLQELVNLFKEKQITFLNEGKSKTSEMLKKVQLQIEKIKKNHQQKQIELEQIFSSKLDKLRNDTNKQISRILGVHAQLKRKYDEFLWVEHYLAHWEQSLLADDTIKMKESFPRYLEEISTKQYFIKLEKSIDSN